jgi:hypothetical protein
MDIDVSTDKLAAEICSVAAGIGVATARLLALVGEFDAREGWSGYGVKSCAHWLAWRCHLSPHAAREYVRVARALRGLPLLQQAFMAGRLSYSKVRALTRIATSDCEADLLDLGEAGTAAQLERTVAGWRRVETLDAAERAERCRVVWHFDEHGMLHLRACLDGEDAAVLLAALDTVAAKQTTADQATADQATAEQATAEQATAERVAADSEVEKASPRGRRFRTGTNADSDTDAGEAPPLAPRRGVAALVGLARSILNCDGDTVRDPVTELVVSVDALVLQDRAAAGLAAYRCGARLTGEEVRRLACDSRLVTMLKDGGEVLDVGRSTRTVSKALRRALQARDGGCAMPGCTEDRAWRLHAHHVWHWADGGPTCLDNLVLVCKAHHHAIHHDSFSVTLAAGGRFVFRNPDGDLLQDIPPPVLAAAPLPEDVEPAPQCGGERLDLDYVLTTLMRRGAIRREQQALLAHQFAARDQWLVDTADQAHAA